MRDGNTLSALRREQVDGVAIHLIPMRDGNSSNWIPFDTSSMVAIHLIPMRDGNSAGIPETGFERLARLEVAIHLIPMRDGNVLSWTVLELCCSWLQST
jgi:hypothetical protein